jgi:hypothetical protein
VPVAALAHGARPKGAGIEPDQEAAVGQALAREPMLPAIHRDAQAAFQEKQPYRMLRSFFHEDQVVVRVLVQAPAVDVMPRRVRIARGAGAFARDLFLFCDLGEGGCGKNFPGDRGLLEKRFPVALDEAGLELARRERLALHHAAQEGDVGRHAGDLHLRERLAQARERTGAVVAAHDELGDHRIVKRRDLRAGFNAGVDPHLRTLIRQPEMQDRAGRRQKIALGVLGVDPCFDGVAVAG